MRRTKTRLGIIALLVMMMFALTTTAFAASEDPTEISNTKYIELSLIHI